MVRITFLLYDLTIETTIIMHQSSLSILSVCEKKSYENFCALRLIEINNFRSTLREASTCSSAFLMNEWHKKKGEKNGGIYEMILRFMNEVKRFY